jgi:hypothetical protein
MLNCSVRPTCTTFIICVVLLFANHYHVFGQQDSAIIINNRLIIKIKQEYKSHVSSIVKKKPNLNAQEIGIRNSLLNAGMKDLRFLHRDSNTIFNNYVVLEFNGNSNIRERYDVIKEKDFVQAVYFDYYMKHTRLMGCYKYHDESYSMEDGLLLNSDYIRTSEKYEDSDMSIVEAWEFTKGDSTLKIGIEAGYIWADTLGGIGPFQSELSSNMCRGINYDIRSYYDICLLNNGTNCDIYNPSQMWDAHGYHDSDRIIHGTISAKIICAKHDSTPIRFDSSFLSGEVGLAPKVKIIPYWPGSTCHASWTAEGIFDAASRGAVAYMISHQWIMDSAYYSYDGIIWRRIFAYPSPFHNIITDAAEEAFSQTGIIFVNAFGNGGTKLPGSEHGFAVAAFQGSHKSDKSSYDSAVTICGNGGHGGLTSFAAPTVAATVALVKSLYPQMSGEEIRLKLTKSTNPLRDSLWSPNRDSSRLGYGALDVYQAISCRLDSDITTSRTISGPIYVSKDIIVHSGDTLRIQLSTLSNGVRRTHVRFATRDFFHPDSIQRTKLIIEGNLIVEGDDSEKVLFSNLRHDEQIDSLKWRGFWGGIVIRNGGTASINNAIIENTIQPFEITGGSTLMLNKTEIGYYDKGAISQNASNVNVDHCFIHNGGYGIFGTGCGNILTVNQTLIDSMNSSGIEADYSAGASSGFYIDSSRISHCKWGIVLKGPAEAYVRFDTIECNSNDGITYENYGFATTTNNRIRNNGQNGIFIYNIGSIPPNFEISNNVIESNGLSASYDASGFAGISIYSSLLYKISSNIIRGNPVGIRLNDATASARVEYGYNVLDSNYISYLLEDKAKTELGLVTPNQSFGKFNRSRIYSSSNELHASAHNSSLAFLQCNVWDQNMSNLFSSDYSSCVIHTPDSMYCSYPYVYYPKVWMLQALESQYDGNCQDALNIFNTIAFDQSVGNDDLKLCLNGYEEIYYASQDYLNGQIQDVLDSLAILYSNRDADLRAHIAYAQGHVMVHSDCSRVDSLLRYADANIQSTTQKRNIMTMLSYVNLYCYNNKGVSDSIISLLWLNYSSDPTTFAAQNTYDLYRTDGIPPIPKHITQIMNNSSASSIDISIFPNPASDRSTLKINLNRAEAVDVHLYDILGRKVASITKAKHCQSGISFVNIETTNLNTGIYYCIITFQENNPIVKKMIVKR